MYGRTAKLEKIETEIVIPAALYPKSKHQGSPISAKSGLPVQVLVIPARPLLRVGDEVRLKIVEAETVDKPRVRVARDLASEAEAEKRHLRKLAKKFGWKIREPRRSK
ncbi:MAG: hypothetical protein WB460_12105 [Candidatus Acidiferrales bacterium]